MKKGELIDAIMARIKRNGSDTVRDASKATGLELSRVRKMFKALADAGEIVCIGCNNHAKVYAIKEKEPEPGLEPEPIRQQIKQAGSARTTDGLSTIEQCRQNWSGYHIHKIFGSAGRVTA